MTEYMRMSGIYWVLTAMDLLDCRDRLSREEVIAAIKLCQDESGGIAPCVGHDPHMLYTLSAVQVCV